MADSDREQDPQKPSEQRGGTTPDEAEAREKGEWAETADEGIVPAEQGGSDAPREMLEDDPELGSPVLGETTGSDEPATEGGIDLSAGDSADAVTDGGAELLPRTRSPTRRTSARAAQARRRVCGQSPLPGVDPAASLVGTCALRKRRGWSCLVGAGADVEQCSPSWMAPMPLLRRTWSRRERSGIRTLYGASR